MPEFLYERMLLFCSLQYRELKLQKFIEHTRFRYEYTLSLFFTHFQIIKRLIC